MSVISDFVDVIKTRLETIGGDYTVQLPTRQGNDENGDKVPNVDKAIKIKVFDVEEYPDFDRPGNPPAVGQLLPIQISIITIPSEKTSPSAFHVQASTNGSTAQNAITSPADWHRIGGNAIDAKIGPVAFVEPTDEGFGSAQFTINVMYRVNETDFETIRA